MGAGILPNLGIHAPNYASLCSIIVIVGGSEQLDVSIQLCQSQEDSIAVLVQYTRVGSQPCYPTLNYNTSSCTDDTNLDL